MMHRIIAATLALVMLATEPLYSQCFHCQVGGRSGSSYSSEASCGAASGGAFRGGLFSRMRERRAERQSERADRRASRQEAGCGYASEAACGAATEADCGFEETSLEDPGYFPPVDVSPPPQETFNRPPRDDDGVSPPQPTKVRQRLGAQAWHPPFPLRPSAIDAPSPFDEPGQSIRTVKSRSHNPFPLGAIVSPF